MLKKTLATIALVAAASSSQALDLIDKKAFKYVEFGYNPVLGSYSPSEPEHDAASGADLMFLNVAAKMPYKGRYQRTWVDAGYQYFETDASTSEIGQQIQRYRFQWMHQFAKPINKNITAWYGGGGSVGFSNYTGRHTIDATGFLASEDKDRSEFDMGVVGSAALEFGIPQYKRIKLGLNAQYEVPLSNSVQGLSVGGYVFYKF